MKIRIFLIFLFSLCASVFAQQYEYYFMVDTSGSMMGLPRGSGNQVIFPDVKAQMKQFLGTIEDNAYVEIIPYDKEMHSSFSGNLSRANIGRFTRFIDGLEATGSVTWIFSNLNKLIERLTGPSVKKNTVRTILLYSDGVDTSPYAFSIQETMRNFGLKAAEYDHLYLKYISLDSKLSRADREFLKRIPKVDLIDLNKPVAVRQARFIEIRPEFLDFKTVKGDTSDERELQIKAPRDLDGSILQLQLVSKEVESHGAMLEVEPSSLILTAAKPFHKVRLRIHNASNLPQKEYSGSLLLNTGNDHLIVSPDTLPILFNLLPERMIEITGKADGGRLDWGRVLTKTAPEDWSKAKNFQLSFNQAAIENATQVRLFLKEGSLFHIQHGDQKGQDFTLTAQGQPQQFILLAHIDPANKGTQEDKLFFEVPPGVSISGIPLVAEDRPGLFSLPLRIRIQTPIPWGRVLIAFGLLAMIALTVFGGLYYCTRVLVVAPPRMIDAYLVQSDRKGIEQSIPFGAKKLRKKNCARYLTIGGGKSDIHFPLIPLRPWLQIWFQGANLKFAKIPELKSSVVQDGIEVNSGTLENGDLLRLGDNLTIKYICFQKSNTQGEKNNG